MRGAEQKMDMSSLCHGTSKRVGTWEEWVRHALALRGLGHEFDTMCNGKGSGLRNELEMSWKWIGSVCVGVGNELEMSSLWQRASNANLFGRVGSEMGSEMSSKCVGNELEMSWKCVGAETA